MTTVLWIAMERDQIFPKPVLHMVLLKDSPAQTEELWHFQKKLAPTHGLMIDPQLNHC
jgi:hypothetical protein